MCVDLQKIFFSSLRGPFIDELGLKAEAEASYHMDLCPVQDSFRFRARHLGLRVASLLINEKGELEAQKLAHFKNFFETSPYLLGPNREGDALIYGHIRNCLKQLDSLWPWIRKFSPPLCHKKAEEVIRHTLWPESVKAVETVHMRRAVLCAWLTFLRQTTGSCFATAPAIFIQQNHPVRFFKDLYDLLTLGQMKRTVAGKEYAVPLNLNVGKADLQRNITGLSGLEFTPGIQAALESIGIQLTSSLQQKIRELTPQSVEKLFRSLLLEFVSLSEEDLKDEEHLARIQMTSLMAKEGAVFYQRPSERAQKVAAFKKMFAGACVAFQAFADCALLRSWEYTLASLCDVKTDFARWNLAVGLGFSPDQRGGIASFLYQTIDSKLQTCNLEIEALHRLYEQQLGAAKAVELMYNNALSEARRHQLQAEFSRQLAEANSLLEQRDRLADRADALSRLFSSLLEQYDAKLQEYFQELFDPALLGEETHFYEDSPAGFRLVYKHGRKDASQWTAVYTGEQYIDCLREFFALIEREIEISPQIERTLVEEITTALIQFIQTPEFLAAALSRAKEQGKRSPWDYISGGTMETLLQSYCSRSHPFTESRIVPHSEEELLRFLAKERRDVPLLMTSPTHAFLFYGGHLPENAPAILEQNKKFAAQSTWDELKQEEIAHRLERRLPEKECPLFLHLFRRCPQASSKAQFRDNLIASLPAHLSQKEALVDSLLFENVSLFSSPEVNVLLPRILEQVHRGEKARKWEGGYVNASELHQLVKIHLVESLQNPFSSIDWDMKIAEAIRRLGYSYPYPLLFADTNWSGWFLGFVIHPVTQRLELWRLNRISLQGFPMSEWKEWLSAENKAPWVLFSRPQEYIDAF